MHSAQILTSVAFVLGLGIGGYYLFRSFDTQVVTAIIAAAVAFGVALTSNFIQRKREVEFRIRERKVEAYQKIFDFMRYFVTATNSGQVDTNKLIEYFYDINYALVMWGNADAIVRWHDIQISLKSLEGDENHVALSVLVWRYKLAELARAIRLDLGHVDKNLSADVLADLYMPLRDKDEFLQKSLIGIDSGSNIPANSKLKS
jgi:hypothetical protein